MQRIWAISWLTIKAAFRFRLIISLAVILLGSVILLPLVIKDDGTARGFTQILLTYTLSLITGLLGFATLWLACGTLARDVEECQIQMVVVKPVARWQIWLGKWFGILAVDLLLLLLSAGAVFFLLQWRARHLPLAQQKILHNEILIARGSAKPPVPLYDDAVAQEFQERDQKSKIPENEREYVKKQIRERLRAENQVTPPGYRRSWSIDLGLAKNKIKGQPISLRTKFNAAQPSPSQTYRGFWIVGDFESPRAFRSQQMSLSADTFHELQVPPEFDLFDATGKLPVHFINLSDAVLLFPEDEAVEVLYREGGFALNYARGVSIIFFWLAFLGAIGLMASSFLSFPVAAFFSIGVLIVGMSTGTMSLILEQNTIFEVNHNTGVADQPALLDYVALPIFKALLKIINLVKGFSPIDSLSTGRSVSWTDFSLAFAQICLLFCGLTALIGISVFTRRELATAQSTP